MVQMTLKIDGMQCGMCESHVNDTLRAAFPLKKVSSSHSKGETVLVTAEEIPEDALRRRRMGFYQRNGFRPLSYDCLLFGVHYRTFLLSPNGKGTEAAAMEAHRGVYRSQLAPWAYEKFVEIPRDPTRPAVPAASWADQTNLPGLGEGRKDDGVC